MLGELGLVGAAATDLDAAALTAGDRGAVGQCDGGVAAVPADYQSVGGGAMLEATGEQGALLIAGVEPVPVYGAAGGGVGDPGGQARAVGAVGRIPTGYVGRARHLVDERQQRG